METIETLKIEGNKIDYCLIQYIKSAFKDLKIL